MVCDIRVYAYIGCRLLCMPNSLVPKESSSALAARLFRSHTTRHLMFHQKGNPGQCRSENIRLPHIQLLTCPTKGCNSAAAKSRSPSRDNQRQAVLHSSRSLPLKTTWPTSCSKNGGGWLAFAFILRERLSTGGLPSMVPCCRSFAVVGSSSRVSISSAAAVSVGAANCESSAETEVS